MTLSHRSQNFTPSLTEVHPTRSSFVQEQLGPSSPFSLRGLLDTEGAGLGWTKDFGRSDFLSSLWPAMSACESPSIASRPAKKIRAITTSKTPSAAADAASAKKMAANTWYVTKIRTKRAIARTACVVRRASLRSSSFGLSSSTIAVLFLRTHRVITIRNQETLHYGEIADGEVRGLLRSLKVVTAEPANNCLSLDHFRASWTFLGVANFRCLQRLHSGNDQPDDYGTQNNRQPKKGGKTAALSRGGFANEYGHNRERCADYGDDTVSKESAPLGLKLKAPKEQEKPEGQGNIGPNRSLNFHCFPPRVVPKSIHLHLYRNRGEGRPHPHPRHRRGAVVRALCKIQGFTPINQLGERND